MPDAHWGYGFPIGGVAAFDADDGRCRLRRRRGLRHLLRGAHPAHRPGSRRHPRGPAVPGGGPLLPGPGGRRQHRQDPPDRPGDGRHARRRGELGGGPGLRRPEDLDRIEEHGLHGGRRARPGLRPCQETPAATRWAPWAPATTTWRSRRSPRSTTPAIAAAFGLAEGDVHGQHPLRLAGPGPPDRHRLPEADGPRPPASTASACRTASWPARRSTPTWAAPTWAPCAPASTAPWPTARSSPTWRARSSPSTAGRT